MSHNSTVYHLQPNEKLYTGTMTSSCYDKIKNINVILRDIPESADKEIQTIIIDNQNIDLINSECLKVNEKSLIHLKMWFRYLDDDWQLSIIHIENKFQGIYQCESPDAGIVVLYQSEDTHIDIPYRASWCSLC